MDRDPRPAGTRHALTRGTVLACAMMLAGCGGHANVLATSGGPPAGGVPGAGSIRIGGQPNSSVGTLIAAGLLVGVVAGSEARPPSFGFVYRANPFMAIQPPAPSLPALDASRSVNEQDCSRPIENPGANLRCR